VLKSVSSVSTCESHWSSAARLPLLRVRISLQATIDVDPAECRVTLRPRAVSELGPFIPRLPLCLCHGWPCCRHADQCDEFAPLHFCPSVPGGYYRFKSVGQGRR